MGEKKETFSTKLLLFIIIGIIIVGFASSISIIIYDVIVATKEIMKSTIVRYVVGMDVNKEIDFLIKGGKIEELSLFYDEITGDRYITHNIINNALAFSVPIHNALAIAYVESRFNPEAINVNWDGSKDVGLFQLNQNSFPNYNVEELLDVKVNARLACEKLRNNYIAYGSWIEAFCKYHRGNVVDLKGIRYAADVLKRVEQYDKKYNLEFGSKK